MTKLTKEQYKAIPRAPSGLYTNGTPYEAMTFDLDVLRLMPDEGATKGRYMPDYLTVPQIKRLLDSALTTGFVSTRLKMMRDAGLVVRTGGKKSAGGWQRTPQGKALAVKDTVAGQP